jgi:hypothetical protein
MLVFGGLYRHTADICVFGAPQLSINLESSDGLPRTSEFSCMSIDVAKVAILDRGAPGVLLSRILLACFSTVS